MNKNRKKIKRGRGKFWAGSGKFFLFIIIVYLLYLGVLKIIEIENDIDRLYRCEDIEIKGNNITSQNKILALCGFNQKDDTKIAIDIDKLAKKIMSLNFVKGVSITPRLPSILNITIEERQPIAFIYGRGLNLIDAQGFLMPLPNVEKVWDFPIITGIRQSLGTLGQQSTAPDTYKALEIVSYLEIENPLLLALVSEINMHSKNYIELYLIKGGATILINKNSFYRELYILKNYLARYMDWAELSTIDYIDLRFKDQLIVKHKA